MQNFKQIYRSGPIQIQENLL